MKIKIHKRWQDAFGNWFPYLMIQTHNVTAKQYAEMHAKSDYANCKYEIVDSTI